jgi:hypothetical protein
MIKVHLRYPSATNFLTICLREGLTELKSSAVFDFDTREISEKEDQRNPLRTRKYPSSSLNKSLLLLFDKPPLVGL